MESGLHVYRYHSAILLLCAKQQILLDQILGIVCVAMIWFVLFLFFIEHDLLYNRMTDHIFAGQFTDADLIHFF